MLATKNRTVYTVLCLAVVAAVLAPGAAYSQPTVEWTQQFRPSNSYCYVTYGHSVAVDSAGNTFGIGYCYNAVTSSSRYDMLVVSYDPNGNYRWHQLWHNSNYAYSYEYVYGVDVDASGNVYVAGYAYQDDGSGYDCYIWSYSNTGTPRWNGKFVATDGYCYGRDVTVDQSTGDVYMWGYADMGDYDGLVVKYNNTGTQQWYRQVNFSGTNAEYVTYGGTADLDSSGNFYGAGYTYGTSYGPNYFAVSYTPTGTLRFMSSWNNDSYNSTDLPYALDVDSSGNSYLNGYSYGSGTSADIAVISFSPTGAFRWENRYHGGYSSDYGYAVYTDDSTVYSAGYGYGVVSGNSNSRYDIVTRSIDPSDGSTNWTTVYNSPYTYRYDYCYGITADLNGVYVVGSCANNPSNTYYDMCILGHDPSTGSLDWILNYDGGRNYYDYGRSITNDGAGCIYAHGYGYDSSSNYALATRKLCSEVECNVLTADADGPYNQECNGQPTSFTLDGRRSCDPNGYPLTYAWSTNCSNGTFDGQGTSRPTLTMDGPPPCPQTCTVSLSVTSPTGRASDSSAVTVVDSTAPSFPNMPGNMTVECDSVPPPDPVYADDVCDPDVPINFNENKVPGRCDGDYVLERTWDATDDCNNYHEDTQIVTVIDTTPPAVAGGDDDLYCITNPNHKYYCFDLAEFNPPITDNCSPPITMAFDGCFSDQPDDGNGDGNTLDDCIMDPAGQWLCARVERAGEIFYGRRYEVWMIATDDCGNTSPSTKVGNIYIPHDSSDDKTCLKQKEGTL